MAQQHGLVPRVSPLSFQMVEPNRTFRRYLRPNSQFRPYWHQDGRSVPRWHWVCDGVLLGLGNHERGGPNSVGEELGVVGYRGPLFPCLGVGFWSRGTASPHELSWPNSCRYLPMIIQRPRTWRMSQMEASVLPRGILSFELGPCTFPRRLSARCQRIKAAFSLALPALKTYQSFVLAWPLSLLLRQLI